MLSGRLPAHHVVLFGKALQQLCGRSRLRAFGEFTPFALPCAECEGLRAPAPSLSHSRLSHVTPPPVAPVAPAQVRASGRRLHTGGHGERRTMVHASWRHTTLTPACAARSIISCTRLCSACRAHCCLNLWARERASESTKLFQAIVTAGNRAQDCR